MEKKRGGYLIIDLIFSIILITISLYILANYVENQNSFRNKVIDKENLRQNINEMIIKTIKEDKKNIVEDEINNEYFKDYIIEEKYKILDEKFKLYEIELTVKNMLNEKYIVYKFY